MNDLISRQAALMHLRKMYYAAEEWGQTADNYEAKIRAESCMAGIIEMKLRVEKMPTAEKVGKWIIRDNPGTGWYRITCSECGEDVTATAPCIGFLPNAKVSWDYCPWCGAMMMRGEEDEH